MDGSLHKSALVLLALLMIFSSSAASASGWVEGKHYERLTPPHATGAPAGKIEVIEFFAYNCPACYKFEPNLVLWSSTRAQYVHLIRVPLPYFPAQRALARLYYTLQALGRIDNLDSSDLHHEVYDAIHRIDTDLASPKEAEAFEAQLQFAKRAGIDPAEFARVYRSPQIEALVQRADRLAKAYRVDSTPTFIVAGQYKTNPEMAETDWNVIRIIGDLAKREAEKPRAPVSRTSP